MISGVYPKTMKRIWYGDFPESTFERLDLAKALAGEQARWEPIALGSQITDVYSAHLSTINERELLILSNSEASPLCYFDTKA